MGLAGDARTLNASGKGRFGRYGFHLFVPAPVGRRLGIVENLRSSQANGHYLPPQRVACLRTPQIGKGDEVTLQGVQGEGRMPSP